MTRRMNRSLSFTISHLKNKNLVFHGGKVSRYRDLQSPRAKDVHFHSPNSIFFFLYEKVYAQAQFLGLSAPPGTFSSGGHLSRKCLLYQNSHSLLTAETLHMCLYFILVDLFVTSIADLEILVIICPIEKFQCLWYSSSTD
jgi:hypothetical protein